MFDKPRSGFGGTDFEDEIDKDDIKQTGVTLRVPHANCSNMYELELDWATLLNIAYRRPARVQGTVTQLLPADGLPKFLRIAFRCPQCWAHYREPQYARDRESLAAVTLDVTPEFAIDLLRAGKTRGFVR